MENESKERKRVERRRRRGENRLNERLQFLQRRSKRHGVLGVVYRAVAIVLVCGKSKTSRRREELPFQTSGRQNVLPQKQAATLGSQGYDPPPSPPPPPPFSLSFCLPCHIVPFLPALSQPIADDYSCDEDF